MPLADVSPRNALSGLAFYCLARFCLLRDGDQDNCSVYRPALSSCLDGLQAVAWNWMPTCTSSPLTPSGRSHSVRYSARASFSSRRRRTFGKVKNSTTAGYTRPSLRSVSVSIRENSQRRVLHVVDLGPQPADSIASVQVLVCSHHSMQMGMSLSSLSVLRFSCSTPPITDHEPCALMQSAHSLV